jgi:hypothetical protein
MEEVNNILGNHACEFSYGVSAVMNAFPWSDK